MKKQARFGKKFRVIAAIEKEDILLLSRLMNILNHKPEMPIDKLGNNMFHMACYLGKMNMVNWIYDNYHLNIDSYNTDGFAPIHLAVKGAHLDVIEWLWEHGADCHALTQYLEKGPIEICCKMLNNKEYFRSFKILRNIKRYLREKYFLDKRGYEVRKFVWTYQKLKQKDIGIGAFPMGIAREIAEFL